MNGDNPALAAPRSPARPALRKGVLGFAVVLLGGLLLVLLFEWSGITLANLTSRLSLSPPWLIPVLMLFSIGQVALSAVKWREALAAYGHANGRPTLRFCIFHSTVANVLSQLVSTYLSSSIVRGAAARRNRAFPTAHGLVSSAYEQLFDVALMGIFAFATVAAWLLHGGAVTWFGFTALGLAVCGAGLIAGHRIPAALRKVRLPAFLVPWAERTASAFAMGLFDRALTGKLFALSLARYAILAGRAMLIAVAVGFAISPLDIARAFTLVLATQFASLTPGNLGLQEWSWSALLALQGTPLAVATEFALTYRVLTFVSMNLAMAVLALATWRNEAGAK